MDSRRGREVAAVEMKGVTPVHTVPLQPPIFPDLILFVVRVAAVVMHDVVVTISNILLWL